ncbi:hypothetical protein RB195_003340 [Necator americanus]|uniref:Uncharacterized protein n=1 Tax=Necator americanus TaxID=51031 RepID=A0ABR1DN47_NECAM
MLYYELLPQGHTITAVTYAARLWNSEKLSENCGRFVCRLSHEVFFLHYHCVVDDTVTILNFVWTLFIILKKKFEKGWVQENTQL